MAWVTESLIRTRGKSPVLPGMVFLLLLCTGAAWGHGDAQWIADDPKLSYCCGVHDCERVPLTAVRPIRGGWEIVSTGQVFMEGDPDLHLSRDQNFWWCRPASMAPKVKCLIRPAGGV